MRHLIHFTGIFLILGIFLIGCDAVISTDDNDLALIRGQGQTQSFATLSVATDVTGDPVADGWEFGGNSLALGTYVQGTGEFNFNIYTGSFKLSGGSNLIDSDWLEGDLILGLGGVINPDASNPNLTHSVRIVSKFGAENTSWSASTIESPNGNGAGSFSGQGGEGALLLGTYSPINNNGLHLHPDPKYGITAQSVFVGPGEDGPGVIYDIPLLLRRQGGSSVGIGNQYGKFIFLFNMDEYTHATIPDGEIDHDRLLSSWQVLLNVDLLSRELGPDAIVPKPGDLAVQTLQRSTGVFTDGLVTIADLAPSNPLTIDDCKKGGWQQYGFRNQGLCIQFVNTGRDSR